MDVAARRVLAQGRRLLLVQLAMTGLVAVGAYLYGHEPVMAWGAIYGGGISMASSVLLGLGVGWAARGRVRTRQWLLYSGAAIRFVLVLLLFALGLGGLALPPVAVIGGFIGAQLVYPFAARRQAAS